MISRAPSGRREQAIPSLACPLLGQPRGSDAGGSEHGEEFDQRGDDTQELVELHAPDFGSSRIEAIFDLFQESRSREGEDRPAEQGDEAKRDEHAQKLGETAVAARVQLLPKYGILPAWRAFQEPLANRRPDS